MVDPQWRRQARSFGRAAEDYDRYRPTYAEAAVRWALGDAATVADIGAGTGILSRLVSRLGYDVTAVEPDDLMRARLVTACPDIPAAAGTAEAIPLPDASVDAVVAGQAYHWFDPVRAPAEIARVLRPGGVFAALRNDADPSVEWTVRFTEIIDGPIDHSDRPPYDFGDRFTPVELAEFRHDVEVSPAHLIAAATTRSPYLVADEAGRARMLGRIRAMLVEYGLADHERIRMPHVTWVDRATRRPDR